MGFPLGVYPTRNPPAFASSVSAGQRARFTTPRMVYTQKLICSKRWGESASQLEHDLNTEKPHHHPISKRTLYTEPNLLIGTNSGGFAANKIQQTINAYSLMITQATTQVTLQRERVCTISSSCPSCAGTDMEICDDTVVKLH